MKQYRCPICGREVEYEGRLPELYPFCSPRCRWVDLGRWLQGEYSIERPADLEDLEQGGERAG